MDLGQYAASVTTTIITLVGIYVIGRKFGQGPAAENLTQTIQQTMAAQAFEIATLNRQLTDERAHSAEQDKTIQRMTDEFRHCQGRLAQLEKYIADHIVKAGQ